MTEVLQIPVALQEPESPEITRLAMSEAASLRSNIAEQAAYFGYEQAVSNLQTPNSHTITRAAFPTKHKFLSPLKGQTVVDLGCGRSQAFRKELIVMNIGAYLGVDLYPDAGMEPAAETAAGNLFLLDEKIPAAVIEGDMLDVVSRLPDDAGSFALNGIDNMIFDPYGEYIEELIRQLGRATAPGGTILGVAQYAGIHTRLREEDAYISDLTPVPDGQIMHRHIKR